MKRAIRSIATAALVAVLPALAGPGALVASIALLAADHDSHHVSVRPDLGHRDIVICHDGGAAESAGALLSDESCGADDHRLHVTNADRFAGRSDAASLAKPAAIAIAPPAPVRVEGARSAYLASAPADLGAPTPLERSTVLQV
jgi:hypothetical protein